MRIFMSAALMCVAVVLAVSEALAALTLVAPREGAVVPTLRAAQKAHLALPRATRLARMDDAKARQAALAVGATQEPLELVWKGAPEGAEVELEVAADGGKSANFTLEGVSRARITNLEIGRLYRWSVQANGEFVAGTFRTEDAAPRLLRAGGVSNFRDCGGWKTASGARVRQNMLFRSAGLRFSSKNVGKSILSPKYVAGDDRVTADGIATLREEFGIRTDVELRSVQECMAMQGSRLGADVKWVHVPFVAYDFIDAMARGKEPFAKLFEVFADEKNYPILMHCSGGRDRTGTVAFLLNGLLGVAEEDLRRDWEFSIFSDPGLSFSSSRLERLVAYLAKLPGATLKERIESYVRGCGVTDEEIAAFRKIMLEI